MELVIRKFFEENTVWDFGFVKTWFNQEKYVYPMYCPCGKIHQSWQKRLEKVGLLCIIIAD